MHDERVGEIAVIFTSTRTGADPAGYDAAAATLARLAAVQPGYRGLASAREPDGDGITVSYWADEASAVGWRDQPEHQAMRAAGRDRWYDRYEVVVAAVTRDYRWMAG
jgi:heme-degrading monooxygenase HmoA